ncbi:MAG: lipocalin family protein [Chromatiales bacterium]|nr:lipocalin family protein [Chromatiales bacterium]
MPAAQGSGLDELYPLLPGDFDNARQVAAQVIGEGQPPMFLWLRVQRRAVEVPALGDTVLYSEITRGAEPGFVTRRILMVFGTDARGRVYSEAWRWRDADEAAGIAERLDRLAGLPAETFERALPDGCTMYWAREGKEWVGRISEDTCIVPAARTGEPRRIRTTEIAGLDGLRTEEAGFTPEGRELFGMPEGVYFEFEPASRLAAAARDPLPTVARVDLMRYEGTWYDIGNLDHRPQRRCTNDTATYTLQDDGSIEVLNRCRRASSRERETRGRAKVVDTQTNARLEVRFFVFFTGDYWIIALDDDYQYALVGTPSRSNLWLLARDPGIDRPRRDQLLAYAATLGFDMKRFRLTPHD